MSDETKIFTKNDKNGDKCASGGQESGLKLIFERGVAILVRPWRFPGQPKKFVFFSIKVGTINSGTSLDSREQFKKTGKLEIILLPQFNTCSSSGVFDRLLVKKSFDLLRLFLNASHMGFCMFFKLSIPFCRRSFGKGRFQIPVQ